jgi:hypothetical protein
MVSQWIINGWWMLGLVFWMVVKTVW